MSEKSATLERQETITPVDSAELGGFTINVTGESSEETVPVHFEDYEEPPIRDANQDKMRDFRRQRAAEVYGSRGQVPKAKK